MAARGELPIEDTSLMDEYYRVSDSIQGDRWRRAASARSCKKPLGQR